jgi:hypothetical protein
MPNGGPHGSNKVVAIIRLTINGEELKGLSEVSDAPGAVIIDSIDFKVDRTFKANNKDDTCRLISLNFTIDPYTEKESSSKIQLASGPAAGADFKIKELTLYSIKDNTPHVAEQVKFNPEVSAFIEEEGGEHSYKLNFSGQGMYSKQSYDDANKPIGMGAAYPIIDFTRYNISKTDK